MLRPRRDYKPFSLQLLDFQHDIYPGTDIPKNFSSRVVLERPDKSEKREVLIYMNNPLRYAGETYYQASFDQDNHGTILQVVRNPSWLALFCVRAGGGGHDVPVRRAPDWLYPETETRMKMLFDTSPGSSSPCSRPKSSSSCCPKRTASFTPANLAGCRCCSTAASSRWTPSRRNALLQIRSTGDVPLEQVPSWKFWHHPKKLKSTEWLLEVMSSPEVADTRPIFLIHHPDLIGELKLGDKGVEKSGLRYYTFNELRPVLAEITEQGRKAGADQEEPTDSVSEAGAQTGQCRHPLPAA